MQDSPQVHKHVSHLVKPIESNYEHKEDEKKYGNGMNGHNHDEVDGGSGDEVDDDNGESHDKVDDGEDEDDDDDDKEEEEEEEPKEKSKKKKKAPKEQKKKDKAKKKSKKTKLKTVVEQYDLDEDDDDMNNQISELLASTQMKKQYGKEIKTPQQKKVVAKSKSKPEDEGDDEETTEIKIKEEYNEEEEEENEEDEKAKDKEEEEEQMETGKSKEDKDTDPDGEEDGDDEDDDDDLEKMLLADSMNPSVSQTRKFEKALVQNQHKELNREIKEGIAEGYILSAGFSFKNATLRKKKDEVKLVRDYMDEKVKVDNAQEITAGTLWAASLIKSKFTGKPNLIEAKVPRRKFVRLIKRHRRNRMLSMLGDPVVDIFTSIFVPWVKEEAKSSLAELAATVNTSSMIEKRKNTSDTGDRKRRITVDAPVMPSEVMLDETKNKTDTKTIKETKTAGSVSSSSSVPTTTHPDAGFRHPDAFQFVPYKSSRGQPFLPNGTGSREQTKIIYGPHGESYMVPATPTVSTHHHAVHAHPYSYPSSSYPPPYSYVMYPPHVPHEGPGGASIGAGTGTSIGAGTGTSMGAGAGAGVQTRKAESSSSPPLHKSSYKGESSKKKSERHSSKKKYSDVPLRTTQEYLRSTLAAPPSPPPPLTSSKK